MVDLDAVPPDVRAHLLGALPHAFAANKSRAKGLGWGIAFLFVLLFAMWFRSNGVRHDGWKLYGATPFIAFAIPRGSPRCRSSRGCGCAGRSRARRCRACS